MLARHASTCTDTSLHTHHRPLLLPQVQSHEHHPCVYMLASDSTTGIMEWQSGYLLSKHGLVRPKHASAALLVELLDEEGMPVWLGRDMQALHSMAQEALAQQGPEDAAAAAAQQEQQDAGEGRSALASPLAGASAAGEPFSASQPPSASTSQQQLRVQQRRSESQAPPSPRQRAYSVPEEGLPELLISESEPTSAAMSRQTSRQLERSGSRASASSGGGLQGEGRRESPTAGGGSDDGEGDPASDDVDVDTLLAAAAAQVRAVLVPTCCWKRQSRG
jgi:hypothetical protein